MAAGNFANCLKVTLAYEGGWADNPKDPGGATMKGITLATFRRYFPKATKNDLRNISDGNVQEIYRSDYWKVVNGDTLAKGVDLATFDAAVNSGPSRAKKWLLGAVGGSDDETVKKLCAARLGFVHALSTWKTFGKGWSRRIAAIEAKGVAWAIKATAVSPIEVKTKLQKEATNAQVAATKQAGAGSIAGGGGTLGGILPGDSAHLPTWVFVALIGAALVVAALLFWRSHIHQQRANAYAEEASIQ